jgi:hypothetical protein
MKFQTKGFTTILLAAAFVVMSLSGIILYLAPRGRVANWAGWMMLGLEKQDWRGVHINLSLLFLIVAGLHLYLNWPLFLAYIKKKGSLALNLKLETLMALLLAVVVLAGTILHIPPFSTIVDFSSQIKDYWERQASESPTPQTEELSVNQAVRIGGVDKPFAPATIGVSFQNGHPCKLPEA